jgi:hypothetical protein
MLSRVASALHQRQEHHAPAQSSIKLLGFSVSYKPGIGREGGQSQRAQAARRGGGRRIGKVIDLANGAGPSNLEERRSTQASNQAPSITMVKIEKIIKLNRA